jgi:L-asparaginase/Glu-tRNA(Gln) amidotransferase subunit D
MEPSDAIDAELGILRLLVTDRRRTVQRSLVRTAARLALGLGLSLSAVASTFAAEEPLPRVHLIATGGTIANARAGRLTVEELQVAVPDAAKLARLPSVEIVLVYQGASGQLIRAAVDAGAKGIVLAGAGAGAIAATQNEAIDYALEHGVVVVRSTRTGSGLVGRADPPPNMTPAQRRRRSEIIPAEDHAPVKARILLMLALTKTRDRAEIERIFQEY